MIGRLLAPLLAACILSTGCSVLPLEGDRLFESNRLEEAASAYLNYLDRHPSTTTRGERALYRLGLIYVLPDSPLHDQERAAETLSRLASSSSASSYGRQAELILTLSREVSRLRQSAEAQATLAASLEDELVRLEERAAEASSAAGRQEGRARQLASEIAGLRSELARLTVALERRQLELQRIKEIDLERLP